MANMFSGKTNKQIPASLNECTQEDATVTNLHTWAQRLENWGRILFWALIIIGTIVTLVRTIEAYELLEDLGTSVDLNKLAASGIEIPTVSDVFLSNLFRWGLYAFLEYCAYHALALLISALASITQHTIISANIALYEASKNSVSCSSSQNAPQSPVSNNSKPTSFTRPVTYTPAPEGMWSCKYCGTHNKGEHGQCKKCGQYRSL